MNEPKCGVSHKEDRTTFRVNIVKPPPPPPPLKSEVPQKWQWYTTLTWKRLNTIIEWNGYEISLNFKLLTIFHNRFITISFIRSLMFQTEMFEYLEILQSRKKVDVRIRRRKNDCIIAHYNASFLISIDTVMLLF